MNGHPLVILLVSTVGLAFGAAGDPQLKTDHPWYPGELSCSTFERLFKTQDEIYLRATKRTTETDEDKALAAWYWRNLNYAHAEDGGTDCFDEGMKKTSKNYEYWHGLFAHGFGLCGTTHAQFNAEMNLRLGHGRSRTVGVPGHNSFEVWLTGGAYGTGRWALLDHDISTVIFSPDGSRLLSIQEIMGDLKTLKSPAFKPERQRGWRVAGLHDDDAAAYSDFKTAEYLGGYAGPAPRVHLRAGESLRRYLKPGLEDGKTFVFWGMNYNTKGVPGPERSRTWVNQPDKMYGSKKGTGWVEGQVRFANAVYTYRPDFAGGKYKEGVVDEADDHVTFEFQTPYVIGCTPGQPGKWGIYEPGGKNGLVLNGKLTGAVKISTDQGKTWQDAGAGADGMDLTDLVKGHQQYWIRFDAGAKALAASGLTMRTVCQMNCAVLPRLHDGENKITFLAGGTAVISAGPNKDQAAAHLVDGQMGGKGATLELAAPRGEKAVRLCAAGWVASGAPPSTTVKYQIEYSTDSGKVWKPVVKDWQVVRHDPDPKDFWSQSFCWGEVELEPTAGPVRVRFSNDGGKTYRKVEAHLVYQVSQPGPVDVTFAWREGGGEIRKESHTYPAKPNVEDTSWAVKAGAQVETVWVEYSVK